MFPPAIFAATGAGWPETQESSKTTGRESALLRAMARDYSMADSSGSIGHSPQFSEEIVQAKERVVLGAK
jgi:hypothetical protein